MNSCHIGNQNNTKCSWYALSIVFIILSFVLGFLTRAYVTPSGNKTYKKSLTKNHQDLRKNQTKLTLINQLLACDDLTSISDATTVQLNDDVNAYIQKKARVGDITHASVYFRDLNNGPWFGVDENEAFLPASLLKVPLLIAALKTAETDSSILTKTASFNTDISPVNATILPENSIQKNKEYTFQELLEYMIRYSDNNAALLVNKLVPSAVQSDVYEQFGVVLPNDADYVITVKNYASFFRILYNATYLSAESSQKALELLTQVRFNKGLVAGLPRGITVAHKFGEREESNTNEKQLHDCGIVYVPNKPYLICVMTRGTNMDKLSATIANISNIVYTAVTQETDHSQDSPLN